MPNLLCPVCGETWDVDDLHEASLPYAEGRSLFRTVGCEVFDTSHNEQSDATGAAQGEEASEMLGDADAIATEIKNGRSVHRESQEADHNA